VGFKDDSRFRSSACDTSEAPFFLRSDRSEAAVADRVVAASFFNMSDLAGCSMDVISCIFDVVGMGHLFLTTLMNIHIVYYECIVSERLE
jgi:hypothetical protein